MLPGWNGAMTAIAIPMVIKHRIINPVITLDLIRKERNNMHLLTKVHGIKIHSLSDNELFQIVIDVPRF